MDFCIWCEVGATALEQAVLTGRQSRVCLPALQLPDSLFKGSHGTSVCLSSSCELEGDDPSPFGIAGDSAVKVKSPEEVWAYGGGSLGPSQCQLF